MFYRVIYSLGKVIATGSPQLFNVFCTYQNFAKFTSSHNAFQSVRTESIVVKYHFSTSNHNSEDIPRYNLKLLNITFLHQTTTNFFCQNIGGLLSNITFLHQTTTSLILVCSSLNCQISLFYIKPQPISIKPFIFNI